MSELFGEPSLGRRYDARSIARKIFARLGLMRLKGKQGYVTRVRALEVGNAVEGSTIASIRRCDGADGREPKWFGGLTMKSAIAVEISFADGRTVIAHPDQRVIVTLP